MSVLIFCFQHSIFFLSRVCSHIKPLKCRTLISSLLSSVTTSASGKWLGPSNEQDTKESEVQLENDHEQSIEELEVRIAQETTKYKGDIKKHDCKIHE